MDVPYLRQRPLPALVLAVIPGIQAAPTVSVIMFTKTTTRMTKRAELESNSLANLPINIRIFVAFYPVYYFRCYRRLWCFISDVGTMYYPHFVGDFVIPNCMRFTTHADNYFKVEPGEELSFQGSFTFRRNHDTGDESTSWKLSSQLSIANYVRALENALLVHPTLRLSFLSAEVLALDT